MCKSREELVKDAAILGLTLDYEPEIVIPNIFKCGENFWHESMNDGIGSSSASVAIGKSMYKSKEELALEKIYRKSKPIDTDERVKYRLDSGHMQESALLKWYANILGYEVALVDSNNPSTSEIKDISEITAEEWKSWDGKGIICVDHARYRHPLYPYMFTDMDAICILPSREQYVLECKTTDTRDYDWNWKSGVWPNARVGNPGYIDQARHHMAVSNMDRCDIIVACDFNADHNNIITVYRDIDEEKKLIDEEGKLWNDYILNGNAPEFTHLKDNSFENICYTIIPEHVKKEEVTIPEGERETISEIFSLEAESKSLKEEAKRIDERINALKVNLIPILNGCEEGRMEGYTKGCEIVVSIKPSIRETFDSKRFKIENPELALKYIKVSESSPKITVKELKKKANS